MSDQDLSGSAIRVATDVPCETRDGTVLRADVYRPNDKGSWPVLLCRTPYDKNRPGYVATARALAAHGYMAAVQDIRGRNASDGRWIWHMSAEGQEVESRDGFDACQWAAALPGSDGQVGTWGNSYPSWCIWRMAAAQPPALGAIFTSGFSVRTLDCTYGIFETGVRLRWQHHMAVSPRLRAGDPMGPQSVAEADHIWDQVLRGKWLWRLPLDEIPDYLFHETAPVQKRYWREINQEFWALDTVHPHVTVPTCTLTGWWDRLLGSADHFNGMLADGPAATRDQHRLIIGPWTHDTDNQGRKLGPRDYGSEATASYHDHLLRWYDWRLKGRDTGIADEPPVKLFILNENRWRFEHAWPPEGVRETAFFLHGGGKANTPRGDGVLSRDEPRAEPPDTFVYDPADPVVSLMGMEGQAAACDQKPNERRQDILVYQTPPLRKDLLVIGPVQCRLWAASDAVDTDFVAKLIEVGVDGLAMNLCHGILRARYRQGYDREAFLTPGEPSKFVIRMMATGILFRKGSRIRLDITSSDFPAFDRNHNTGKPFYADNGLKVARQTVFHDRGHPSHLLLPVMPR